MQNSKIDIVANANGTSMQDKMLDLQHKLMDNSIQDLEIMEQFCMPNEEIPFIGVSLTADRDMKKRGSEDGDSDEATSETPGKIEPPELA